jgi:hypothetical protein
VRNSQNYCRYIYSHIRGKAMLSRFVKIFALLSLACGLLLPSALWAQTGHPAKGSWSGELTPASGQAEHIRLLINAKNGDLSGTVNPGRKAIDMSSVELDPTKWALDIKAKTPEGDLILKGTLSNLGSWTNRKYIGTYTQGAKTGKFEITLN